MRLLSALLLLWVARQAWKIARGRAGPDVPAGRQPALRFLRERLGYGSPPDVPASTRWLHAASVGEVMTALPLIRATAAAGQPVLVTTATPTGAAVLDRQAVPGVRHRFLPLDLPGAVDRFMRSEQPVSGWIIETELWPWLFATAKRYDVALTLVSARVSARTDTGLARVLRPVYRHALLDVRVLARSPEDAQRIAALGAQSARLQVMGDLKRALPAATGRHPVHPFPAAPQRPFVIAASTHADEERELASAWLRLAGDELLVIAPRHPARSDAIERALIGARHGPSAVPRRSRGEAPASNDRVCLADTFGELERFYAHASAVFMGGSLIPRGGHNLLEPARHGTPIGTGPHTANFTDVVDDLLAADAVRVCPDADVAATWMLDTLRSGDRVAGARAQAVARADACVLPRYLAALLPSEA